MSWSNMVGSDDYHDNYFDREDDDYDDDDYFDSDDDDYDYIYFDRDDDYGKVTAI